MSGATAEQLRALVSDYYHGLLTFDSYREQRGRLLDTLGSKPQAAPTAPKPPAVERTTKQPPTAATPAAAPTAKPATAPVPRRAGAPRWGLLVAGAAAAAVTGFVAYRWLMPAGDPQPAAAENGALETLSPGEALLERFIQVDAWDSDAARTLGVAWSRALSEDARQTAMTSATYRRFGDLLRRRLRQEEALAASTELDTLLSLARELGVRYSGTRDTTSVEPAPTSAASGEPPAPVTDAAATDVADATPEAAEVPADPASERATVPAPLASGAPASPQQTTSTAPAGNAPTTAAAPAVSAAPARSSACNAELLNTRRPICADTLTSGGNGPTLAIVPAGEFDMGHEQTPDADPVHRVVIGEPFAMSVYEVSFADFRLYCTRTGQRCPENPWSDDVYPVVTVSWAEATGYAEWLSQETGFRYELPSETQWEYAARAGSPALYPFGDNVTPASARSSANGPVSSPIPSTDRGVNPSTFRLVHMIGNVREWVADGWQAGYSGAPNDGRQRPNTAAASDRVVRGGSYADSALQLRSAARLPLARTTQDAFTGFRVVRQLVP